MALIPYLNAGDSITAERWNTLFEELDRKLNTALDNHSLCFWYNQSVGRYFEQFFGQCFFFHDANPHFSDEIFEGMEEDLSDYPLVTPGSPIDAPAYVNYNHAPFTNAAALTAIENTLTPTTDHTRKIVRLRQVDESYYVQIGRPDIRNFNIGLFNLSLEAMTRIVLDPSTGFADRYKVFVRNDPGPELIYKYANVELIYEGPNHTNVVFPRNYNKFNFFRIHNLNSTAMTFTFKGSSNQNIFTLTIPAYGSKCVRRDSVNSGYLEGFSHFHRFKSGDYRFYCAPLELSTRSGYASAIGIKRGATKSNNVVNPQLAFMIVRKMELGGPAQWHLDPARFWDASSLYSPNYFANVENATILGDLLHHKGTLGLQKISPSTKSTINYRGYAKLIEDFGNAGFTVTPGTSDITLTKTGEHDFLSVSTNLISARYGAPGKTFTNSITLDCVDDQSLKTLSALPLDLVTTNNTFSYRTFTSTTDADGKITVSSGPQANATFAVKRITEASAVTVADSLIPIHTTNLESLLTLGEFGTSAFNSTNQNTTYTTQDEREVTLTGFGAILTWTKRVSSNFQIEDEREWSGGTLDGGVMDSSDSTNGLTEFDGTNFIRRKFVHFSGYGWPTWYPGTDVEGGANPMPDIHGAFNSPRKIPRFGRYRFLTKTNADPDIYFPSSGTPFGVHQAEHSDFSHIYEKQTADDSTLKSSLGTRANKPRIGVLSEFSLLNVYLLISAWAAESDYFVGVNPITSLPHKYEMATLGYNTYRSEITANNPTNLSYLNGPLVFDRLLLLVDHYNNLASVVNAIHKIRPLHFHGFYDEAEPNTDGIFGTSIRPVTQYAAYDSTSDNGYVTLLGLGIVPRTASDFPASYNDLIAATKKIVRPVRTGPSEYSMNFIELAEPLLDATWKTILFGSSTASQGDHYWFKIEDVKTRAEQLGFKFYFQSAVIPLKLTITDGTSASRLYNHPANRFGFTPSDTFINGASIGTLDVPARFPAFVNCEIEDEIEWVKTMDVARVREDYEPADVFAVQFIEATERADVWEIVTDSEWRKRNWNSTTNTYATQLLYSYDQSYFSLLFINYLPDGVSSTSKVIAHSSPYISFQENFSQQGAANAVARQSIGLQAIPGTIENTASIAPAVLSTTSGNNFITAENTGLEAADLTFFVDILQES